MSNTNHHMAITITTGLRPPEGYESWLECAVATFDPSQIDERLRSKIKEDARSQIKEMVWAEFIALRSSAGLLKIESENLMRSHSEGGSVGTVQMAAREAEDVKSLHSSAQYGLSSLLDVMEKMPRSDGIEFDPIVVGVEKLKFSLDE